MTGTGPMLAGGTGVAGGKLAGGTGVAGSVSLEEAILALNPLSYWTLRDGDYNDYGSLNHDLSQAGTITVDVAGADGTYPRGNGLGTGHYLEAADDIAYEPQHASGLTLFFLLKPSDTSTAGSQYVFSKASAAVGSWTVFFTNSTARLFTSTHVAGGLGGARSASALPAWTADTNWHACAVRYSGSATGFPSLRADGGAVGSTSGAGTAEDDSSPPVRLFGAGSGGTLAALGHPAIFAGQLTDGDLATIEAAAIANGW